MTNIPDPAIAALASGSGQAAIAIIRGSGENSHTLLQKLIETKQSFSSLKPGRTYLCDIKDPSSGEIIDRPLLLLFQGPRSYTGEDSFELHVHGGSYIIQRTLRLLYENGFQQAGPGEFTQRAFLNGKMDLSEAEGIQALVTSVSEQQWKAGRQLAQGILKNHIESLKQKVLEAMAFLEARIDFPDEEETSAVEFEQVDARVEKVKDQLIDLASTYHSGKIAKDGLRVALVGAPNSGKSTLMNYLLGEQRAIVTDIAGTTRDYLEESCLIEGQLVRLIDTAGIRNNAGKIEQIGIERSFEIARTADMIMVLASSEDSEDKIKKLDTWLQKIISNADKNQSLLFLKTKSDLKVIKNGFQSSSKEWLPISCESSENMDLLKKKIRDFAIRGFSKIEEKPFLTTTRHLSAVENARTLLLQFFEKRREGAYEEMLAFELREAAFQLESIIGRVDNEDVLGVIFSQFCVGK